MKSNNLVRNAVVLLITVALCVALGVDLMKQHVETPIVVGENVTEVRKLSDWNPALKGTSFDSTVFVLKGEEEGRVRFDDKIDQRDLDRRKGEGYVAENTD